MKAQNGLCYYCDQPMWLQDIKGFCARYRLTQGQALLLKCTAEHMIARADGGPDTDANIVAACHYCNQARHRAESVLEPKAFQLYARSELNAGRWHELRLGLGGDQ